MANFSTHFWQRPKNQLTLLGCYGRNTSLSFFDLDEYLVLPGGGSINNSMCLARPLLDKGAAGRLGSWNFVRFQAKTCPESNSDLPCWEDGRGVSGSGNIKLLHDVCPMSTGHAKQVIVADMVDIVSVHFTFSERFEGNQLVNMSCGYLLHFYSLLMGRRSIVTATLRKIPALTWNFHEEHGRRQVKWPAGLAPVDYETCKADASSRLHAVARYRDVQARPPIATAVTKNTPNQDQILASRQKCI